MKMKDKKKLMIAVAFGLASTISFGQSLDDIVLNVYKEVTCGCCVGWIQHMDERGYSSNVFHPTDIQAV